MALEQLPSGKLTKQWEIHQLKMYLLLEMVVSHCYVGLPEGSLASFLNSNKCRRVKWIEMVVMVESNRNVGCGSIMYQPLQVILRFFPQIS